MFGRRRTRQVTQQPVGQRGNAPGEHDCELPGVALHYATWGDANPARATLLVHGLTASHREWAEVGPALAAGGRYVIAPDLRGRGRSGKPSHGYGVPFHANDLLALCDALGLAQMDVVGHSLGAVIGMYMAALYPQRVRRLVMIDAGGKIPEDTAQAIAVSVSRLGASYPSLDAYLAAMSQSPAYQWGPFWEQYFRYDAQAGKDGSVTSSVPRAAIEEESAALAMTRSEALPPFVKQPTLILRATIGMLGGDRGFILPAEEAERLRGVMGAAEVVEIPETNHYTIIQAPALQEAVARFLTDG
jgi:pimeloyl-ACP methyl ester carboxylesterase